MTFLLTPYGVQVFVRTPVADMNKATVKRIPTQIPTKKAMKPKPKVSFRGEALEEGIDYTLSYKNNKNGGKATIVIKGKGNFVGVKNVRFTILPRGKGKTITKAEFNRIKLGMTHKEVKALVGGNGTLTYEWIDPYGGQEEYWNGEYYDYEYYDYEYYDVEHTTYEWKGSKSYSGASIQFEDDVVVSKSQWGL